MSNIGVKKISLQRRVSISKMKEHDLLEVVEIEEASGLSRWGWDAYYGELVHSRDTIMLVACPFDEERSLGGFGVLGFIASRLTADELHINNMAVREGWRKSGIGALLLGSALEEGKRCGARRSFLEVRASNEAAQALYYKFGFRATARRPGYYTEPLEDALLMSAALT